MGRFGMLGLRSLGAWVIAQLTQLGMLAGFYARLSMLFWSAFTRPRLLLAQLHFVGNRSLAITLVSGLLLGLYSDFRAITPSIVMVQKRRLAYWLHFP